MIARYEVLVSAVDELNAAERLLVRALQAKDTVVSAVDRLRPKIIFKHSLDYYRRVVHGEVYVQDIARALGAPRVRVTY